MSEIEQIKKRYEKRNATGLSTELGHFTDFIHLSRAEREYWGTILLRKNMGSLIAKAKVLEIGAGHGDNVHFLMRAGFQWKNIFLNELLEDRWTMLLEWLPKERVWPGDILEVQTSETFDLIYQSTVFSSILDKKVRDKIIDFSFEHLSDQGFFIWYDFCYDNPKNKDVKGIRAAEVKKLLGDRFELVGSKKVTLAPPLGRRVGRFYNFFNSLFPFLRTHQLMLFRKRSGN